MFPLKLGEFDKRNGWLEQPMNWDIAAGNCPLDSYA
jgi:hypothetical protein